MYLVNENFNNVKIGDIAAFDIGGYLGSINQETTLIKVLDIADKEPFYNYEDETFESLSPLVKYINIKTNQEDECDIAWVFTKGDVERCIVEGYQDNRLKLILEEFEAMIAI